nr:hypothetical protein [Tanacetum cinerariifolium]
AWDHSKGRSQAIEAQIRALHAEGTEGVIDLTQWFEKIEFVFPINNCTVACQIKDATCTFLGNTLTWSNSHVRTVGHDAAYGMTWKTLMKMMTDKYCLRGEIKKLEIKIWNLKVKGMDVVSYIQCFQELSLMCGRMFPEESDQVEKYVGGLPDMIQGSVMAPKPKTMQEAIKIANDLMDQNVRTFAKRKSKNKRKLDDNTKNNQTQQQPFKRQNVARAYTAEPGEKREYGGSLPLSPAAANNQRAPGVIQKVVTCYEGGVQGHYKKDCLKLKNKNSENQAGNVEAHGKAYVLEGSETNTDSNVVTSSIGHSMDSEDSSSEMCHEVLMDSASSSIIEINLDHARKLGHEIHAVKPQTCSSGVQAIS